MPTQTPIAILQDYLRWLGYQINDMPGVIGPQTKRALEGVQSKYGLEVTGRVDDETVLAIWLEAAVVRALLGAQIKDKLKESISLQFFSFLSQQEVQQAMQEPVHSQVVAAVDQALVNLHEELAEEISSALEPNQAELVEPIEQQISQAVKTAVDESCQAIPQKLNTYLDEHASQLQEPFASHLQQAVETVLAEFKASNTITEKVQQFLQQESQVTGITEEIQTSLYGSLDNALVGFGEAVAERLPDLEEPLKPYVKDGFVGTLQALLDELQEEGNKHYVVSGRVVNDKRVGLEGVCVALVSKKVGGDIEVEDKKDVTDKRGGYRIEYLLSDLGNSGTTAPDIQIKVKSEQNALLAESEVRYGAGREEIINVTIPADKLQRFPEYTRLKKHLAAYLNGHELKDLKENKDRHDISFLANKTGWDARMVAMIAQAEKMVPDNGKIPVEYFYAIFRTGIPANKEVVYRLHPNSVKAIWEQAIERQIISGDLESKIGTALAAFKEEAVQQLESAPPKVGRSSLAALLQVSLGNDKDQKTGFVKLFYEHQQNTTAFWEAIAKAKDEAGESLYKPEQIARLKLDGKLAFFTLNNAPLMESLHAKFDNESARLESPLSLVRAGYYKPEAWRQLIDNGIEIPEEIPGAPEEKADNYADLLASQLRLAYPTATIAEMINSNEIKLGVDNNVKDDVYRFFTKYQGKFELGLHPINSFVRSNNIAIERENKELLTTEETETVLTQVKRLQRLYQVTPSTQVMSCLMEQGVDSAYSIVQFSEDEFQNQFGETLDETETHLTYAKAQQVHNTILNIATSYMLYRSAPAIHTLPAALPPKSNDTDSREETAVLDYSTLETLFGEMDYCDCEHCRSVLSPAAYLVDLLQFLDLKTQNAESENPLDVFLERRPDIANLQLSCENTNIVLPYIDLVNEILEHQVASGSLDDFIGHNVEEGVTSEELLANPQFIEEEAYKALIEQKFPPPLPFHQPLEALRRYFVHFQVPLHAAMETLRRDDALERPEKTKEVSYTWRDIMMERLQLSQAEYAILTDSTNIQLAELFGEEPDFDEEMLLQQYKNAKTFARRLNLKYVELANIICTQFINPHSHLIPKLERLGVGIDDIVKYLDADNEEKAWAKLNELLPEPEHLDEAPYGGDVKAWLRDNEAEIKHLIVLWEPASSEDLCSFDNVELHYANNDTLQPIEFLKLLRFIRLWRKLGWSIEETDKAVSALYPNDKIPMPDDSYEAASEKLDSGFAAFLVRLAHLVQIMETLNLKSRRDLLPLLALWSPIDTRGTHSLYRQMFLNPTILVLDDIFQEDGYGNYLADKKEFQGEEADPEPTIDAHKEALRAAFNLTGEEFDLISAELKSKGKFELDENKKVLLNLANISAIFRHAYLARALRLSVYELLALKDMSGLDPFRELDFEAQSESGETTQPFGAVRPHAVRFIELAQRIKNSPFTFTQLLYLLQHIDLGGQSSPSKEDVLSLARTLRQELLRIEREIDTQADPDDEITKAKMALVYGSEAADVFFGLLNDTLSSGDIKTATFFEQYPGLKPLYAAYKFFTQLQTIEVYEHDQEKLEDEILEAANGRLSYSHADKKLLFVGVLEERLATRIKEVAGISDNFKQAIDRLYTVNETAIDDFFEANSVLEDQKEAYLAANDVPEQQRSVLLTSLLASFLPTLKRRLKSQQVSQTVSALVGVDPSMMTTLLEEKSILHAVEVSDQPAMADFLVLENPGLSWTADRHAWQGYLEASDNGVYKFSVETDPEVEATVTLEVQNGEEVLKLEAGRLYKLTLTPKLKEGEESPIEPPVDTPPVIKWEREGMGLIPIPATLLYPDAAMTRFTDSYLRMLKALALADKLVLSHAEMAHFATHKDYQASEAGWLNALPVKRSIASSTTQTLLKNITALLQYHTLKEALHVSDDQLLELLKDPEAKGEDGQPLLDRVTGWSENDYKTLLEHFGLSIKDSIHLEHFTRTHEALAVIHKLGIGAVAMIAVTTNAPATSIIRDLQGALRARYEADAWLKVIQPINDELRRLQRNALVAYVLHQMAKFEETKHINTPDKLFEYFWIDVQMDSCMKTSRVKQAISSTQLFIQRCLLNLEPRVASSPINAQQWEWMKRYRVWEANRKIFLFPENWLEPELRDNKSPIFRELESELLQSDITDDRAATALFHYLQGLNQVAKLEICGMHVEEHEVGYAADDIIHVIGRTSGTPRQYYYRRFEYGYWTPWEKIGLTIEDNPVLLVVWRGRLFLFWLGVMQKAPEDALPPVLKKGANKKAVVELETTDIVADADSPTKAEIQLTLFFSEYTNGSWQPPKGSSMDAPLSIGGMQVNDFDRNQLSLRSSGNSDLPLTIEVFDYFGFTLGTYRGRFELYNTHSSPFSTIGNSIYQHEDNERHLFVSEGFLEAMYLPPTPHHGIQSIEFRHRILGNTARSPKITEPLHPLIRQGASPFFLHDQQHDFFVQTTTSPIEVIDDSADPGYSDHGTVVDVDVDIPDLVEVEEIDDPLPPVVADVISGQMAVGPTDPNPMLSYLSQSAYINKVIASTGAYQYVDEADSVLISVKGAVETA